MPRPPRAAAPQKSSETEPCDCTQPVGFEPPADWTCAPYSRLVATAAPSRRTLVPTTHAPSRPYPRSKATARDYDPMWAAIRAEAQADADAEPLLSSFIYASVLSHPSFDRALAFVLANRLACPQLLAVQLVALCHDVLESEEQARGSALIAHALRLRALTRKSALVLRFGWRRGAT